MKIQYFSYYFNRNDFKSEQNNIFSLVKSMLVGSRPRGFSAFDCSHLVRYIYYIYTFFHMLIKMPNTIIAIEKYTQENYTKNKN